jgi:hypothetical protein
MAGRGLQGDYRGSCVVCMQGTDTGLVFRGPAEFAIAGLVRMGVPQAQGAILVSKATGTAVGSVPSGDIDVPLRVCANDAARAGLSVGLIPSEAPLYAM